jgi:nicotinamidase-related amidase
MEDAKGALLMLDFQVGVGDLPYAENAVTQAVKALEAGRKAGMVVIFSKVAFRPGYPEVSTLNQVFATIKEKNVLPSEGSRLLPIMIPREQEFVVDKKRFSAFCGSDLELLLRGQDVKHLVIAGLSTSGVILSTFCEAADKDYQLTILSDACADPQDRLHRELIASLFPRSANVTTVAEWAAPHQTATIVR